MVLQGIRIKPHLEEHTLHCTLHQLLQERSLVFLEGCYNPQRVIICEVSFLLVPHKKSVLNLLMTTQAEVRGFFVQFLLSFITCALSDLDITGKTTLLCTFAGNPKPKMTDCSPSLRD